MATDLIDNLPVVLRSVDTKLLFVMRLDVRKLHVIGFTPGAHRRVGIVEGGVFEGERMSGEVLQGGSDWQNVRADGSVTLDVRLVLRTTEGALVGMTYRGLRQGAPDVIARLDAGNAVDPSEYYFRISPSFETAAPSHIWLNDVIAIGIGHRLPAGPIYSVFEVL